MSASSSSNDGGKPSGRPAGRPAVHADDRARGNTLWGNKLSDTLSDSLSGKPCAGTRTGSSLPPPSPDRLPLHLTMTVLRWFSSAFGSAYYFGLRCLSQHFSEREAERDLEIKPLASGQKGSN